jgi:2-oxoglutarate ferredoxin oxidoreductase subunit delta
MPEAAPVKRGKGTVFVKDAICKGCAYCIEFCPSHCIEFSPGFNAKGYHYPVLARPEDCTGCGMCENYCPDFAIRAIRFSDLKKKAKTA